MKKNPFDLSDPELRMYVAYEEFIESFLEQIDAIMNEQAITKLGLAKRMGYKFSVIKDIFDRTTPILSRDMAFMAFHLGVHIDVKVKKGDLPAFYGR